MNLTLIICAIGIFVLISTFIETRKQKKNMDELVKIQKCKEHSYYQKPMIMLSVMLVLCLVSAFLGIRSENENVLNMGLLLSFVFLAEIYRSYFVARIYHNDEGFVANDRFVKFRSIKSFFKNSSLPFAKWTILTYTSEKIVIVSKTAQFINDNYHHQLPASKNKKK